MKEIDDLVTDWVGTDKPFTAYSVFVELRKTLPDLKYQEVKKEIHDAVKPFVTQKAYCVVQIESPTGTTLLYHAPGYDPESFFSKKS